MVGGLRGSPGPGLVVGRRKESISTVREVYIMYTEYSSLMSRWTMIARSKDEVEEDERWNGKKKRKVGEGRG